jgi:hypothetical protein
MHEMIVAGFPTQLGVNERQSVKAAGRLTPAERVTGQ